MRVSVVLAALLSLTALALAAAAASSSAASTSAWSPPSALLTSYPDKYGPAFGEAANGDAVVAYTETTNVSSTLVAYNYTPAGGWSSRVALSDPSLYVYGPVVAVGPDGSAMVIATAGDLNGTPSDIAYGFSPGVGWFGPMPVPLPLGNANFEIAAASANGDVIAVLDDFNATDGGLFAVRFTMASGFEPVAVELATYNGSGQPIPDSLDVGANGEAAFT